MKSRTARLTLLIDPQKKADFEQLCAEEDITPSQKVRQFIRCYIKEQRGELPNNLQHETAVGCRPDR